MSKVMRKEEVQSNNPAWPLIFLTHAVAGLFFAYETAGALGPVLAKEMGFTDHQIGLLYSAFISIFVSGYLNKKFGAPKCVVLLSCIVATGVSIIAAAPSFRVMFIGQLIYGCGASPMYITCSILTGRWFGTNASGRRKLSLAVGIQFAWMRFHSFAAFVTLPLIAEVDFSVCWSCFASGVLFYFVDRTKKYSENVFDAVELKDVSEVSENPSLSRSSLSNGEEEDIYGYDSLPLERKRDMRRVPECGEERKAEAEVEGGTTLSATLVSTTSTTEADDMEQLVLERGRDEKEAGDGDRREKTQEGSSVKKLIAVVMTVVNTVRGFPITYWLVLSLMVIFTCDLYTTTAFLTKYLVDINAAKTDARAADITSLVCLANVLTSPLAGWLSGYTGWKVKYLILGSLNLVLIHSLFAFAHDTPAIVLASALGLTQSIMDTNLWPALIFTVSKQDYPVASSLVTLSYNFGLIIFPTFCGFLKDITGTWLSVNLAFMALSSCAVILSCVLKFVDMRHGNLLDLPFIKQPVKAYPKCVCVCGGGE